MKQSVLRDSWYVVSFVSFGLQWWPPFPRNEREQDAEWQTAQRAAKKAKEAAWKARARARRAENYVEPYADKIIKCVRLVAMLQKYVRPAQAAAAPVSKSGFKVPEGVSILKKDREMDG
jgi:hypothetical protein